MISDFFRFATSNIRHRKMRSWLTMIGIFIGIAAVVSLISLGQGLSDAIDEQFEMLGKDKLFVQPKGEMGAPGSGGAVTLTTDDVEVMANVKGIEEAAGMIFKIAKVEINDQIRYEYVWGMEPGPNMKFMTESMSLEIIEGRNLRTGDRHKIVLGYNYLTRSDVLYGKQVRLRDRVLINDIEFEVIGFWDKIGNPSDDQSVAITDELVRELYDLDDETSMIWARVSKGLDPSKIGEDVEKALRDNRDVEKGKEDFTVQTPEELMESFGNILAIVQGVLIGIAAISLLVGGVGIMNTMYTAVLERTNEVGIMKAIGAKNSDVLKIFLIEAGTLGMVGGIIGIIIGYGLGKLVEFISLQAGIDLFRASFPWYLIVGALVFSFGVGCIAGVLPAIRASKLKPVEALRYE